MMMDECYWTMNIAIKKKQTNKQTNTLVAKGWDIKLVDYIINPLKGGAAFEPTIYSKIKT